jgi:hypothetical protein
LEFLHPKDFGNNIHIQSESNEEESEDDEPVITTRKKKTIGNK